MDYGFAPGNTPQDGRIRTLFSRRTNTTLISARHNRSSTRDFIQHLDSTGSIAKPVEDLLLGSHANSQGYLFTPMFRGQRGPTSFEILEDTVTGTNTSIEIPDSLIGYTTGDPVIHNFHIKGCNIGKATPFLQKMKEVLGDHVNVTAPKHFHGIYFRSSHGTWELMAYEFRLVRKNAFATRADYITDLDAEGFTFYNGDPVPTTDWEAWVPQRINRNASQTINWPLGVTLDRRSTIPFPREFRYKRDQYTFTITYPNASAVPSSDADRMSALETALNEYKYRETDDIGAFDSSHPYPEYERWGYDSLQDFLDEHDWRFQKNGRRLVCRGVFHAYTLIIPITDKSATNLDNLIFNFYPKAGSSLTQLDNMLVSDTDFFATV